jgi:hypothetical protein
MFAALGATVVVLILGILNMLLGKNCCCVNFGYSEHAFGKERRSRAQQ